LGNFRPMNEKLESFWIKLNGQSMTPMLLDQDLICIAPIRFDELKLGDIVLFKDQQSNELTIHRFINYPFTTKGDFSCVCEINPPNCLLGRAIAYRRADIVRNLIAFNNIFLFFSKLRMSNYVIRKIGLIGLIISTFVFELYNAKTKSDHTK
jgi:signal peptidase I